MIPREIKKTGPTEITVTWDDSHVSVFAAKQLRCACRCAGCVDEITGRRILDPDSVSDAIAVSSAEHVGRYGVKFVFSDGHDDGIFTWSRLREICSCFDCARTRVDREST